MNNYKKQPFIPAIQKTSTLVALSFLSLVCFLGSINVKTIDVSPSYSPKVEAANLMKKAMAVLKHNRMEQSVFIDIENVGSDPADELVITLSTDDQYVVMIDLQDED